jgi:ABC-type lipoprotein release transport system permease subunit
LYVRTWQAPESIEATIRHAMQSLNSNLVLNNLHTMREQIDENLTDERVIAYLASSFGVLAAIMTAIGIGVSNSDPLTLGVVIVFVAAVAFVSAALPARRAAKVDPMVALRYE